VIKLIIEVINDNDDDDDDGYEMKSYEE